MKTLVSVLLDSWLNRQIFLLVLNHICAYGSFDMSAERLTTNMTVEVENDSKILKAHCICEDFSSAQDLVEGVFHVTPSSSTLQGDDKGIDFKGKSAIQVTSVQDCFCSTAQKHSVSLEVNFIGKFKLYFVYHIHLQTAK